MKRPGIIRYAFLQQALFLLLHVIVTTSFQLRMSTGGNQKSGTFLVPNHVFIFGLGYTGLALVSAIKREYPECIISGTCRSLDKAENLKKFGIETYIFDPDVSTYLQITFPM